MKTNRTFQNAGSGGGHGPAHDEIARRAYELWQQEGCPEGRAWEHWLEAEKQLRGTRLSALAEAAVLDSLRT